MKWKKKIIKEVMMPQTLDNNFKIRDLRRTHFYTVDNVFIDEYAGVVGLTASMIYIVLCRHAGKDQTAFPSQETIAKKLRIARETVNRNLKPLTDYNIISYTKTIDKETGERMNNTYTLMDKSAWKPCDAGSHGVHVTQDHMDQAQAHVTQDHTKNTGNLKKPIKENFSTNPTNEQIISIRNEKAIKGKAPGPASAKTKYDKPISNGRRFVNARDII
jgi:predicted transcriptional regulator